jgi:hypothetical protein
MTVAMLLKLLPGQRLIHLPTDVAGTVIAPATPSRQYGWRVQVRSTSGICWLTPANISDWSLAYK